ncbi:MAG: Gfo/Idh/MocA family oxidoreductase [Rhizomicrobium sp.]
MTTGPALRIGVAGLGLAGSAMISAILDHPGVILAGGADRDAELRGRFAQDHAIAVDGDAAELFRRADIDAVYIATPHQFHRAHTVAALQAGKHVIVEKPMALSLADCDAMIAEAHRWKRMLIVGHTHAYDPSVRYIREIVRRGDLGSPSMISMWTFTDFLYRPRRPEELDTARGGGILFNQIPHQVAVASLLAGRPAERVRAMTHVLDPRRPTEGSCTALIDFGGGLGASIVYSGYDHFDSDEFHSWVAENGREKVADQGRARRALAGVSGGEEALLRRVRYGYGGGAHAPRDEPLHQPHFGILVVSCEKGDLKPSRDGVTLYAEDGVRDVALAGGRRPGHRLVLDDLCAAVHDGVPPQQDGLFGRETLRICLAIQRSAAERREVAC